MQRIGFTLTSKVHSEKMAAYKRHHQAVWPELRAALSVAGWHNYLLFSRPDGLLFGYFKMPISLADVREKMVEAEVNAGKR